MIFTFDSTMPGALQLSGTAGALKNILKTYLVDGAGAGLVATLTVADGVATATYASGHPFRAGAVAQVSGATPTGLNGLKPVLTVSANAITFAAPGMSDGAATGSITSKLAPAGWAELYAGTANVLALKPSVPEATGCVLRVDDTGTTSARVVGYCTLIDIGSGTGPFPTDAQQAGGLYWPKAHNTTGARPWALVADERAFYLYVQPTSGNAAGSIVGFGDFASATPGPWDAFVAGHAAAVFAGGAGCLSAVNSTPAATLALPKPGSGVGESTPAYLASGLRTGGVSGSATGSQLAAWPNPANGDLVLMQPWIIAADGLRGRLPGLWHTPQDISWLSALDAALFPGLLPVRTEPGKAGVALLDMQGGWR
jgi:hypothetical protein